MIPPTAVLQNEELRVACVPGHGMLLTEIVPLEHGINLLWQRNDAPLHGFDEPAVVTKGHDPFDEEVFAGGWFGMFPNAGIPGLNEDARIGSALSVLKSEESLSWNIEIRWEHSKPDVCG